MDFRGQTIVVTGCSSGIGAETARLMRFHGGRVIGIDHNDPLLTLDSFVRADLFGAHELCRARPGVYAHPR